MHYHNFKDYLWFLRFRLKTRLGYNPIRLRNGQRRQLTSIGLRRIEPSGEPGFQALRLALCRERFFVARLGYTEARTFGWFRQYQLGLIRQFSDDRRRLAQVTAGIFSNDDPGLEYFCQSLANSASLVTHFCTFSTEFEPLIIGHYAPKAKLVHASSLEHFWAPNSWMEMLRGKKVLVVSPFSQTIEKQYGKKELLFPNNPSANPIFQKLVTIKAEMTNAGNKPRFPDWKTTLEYMYSECMKLDFDVAILSCGGYGLSLGAMLFSAGKNVIHAGGIVQLYFGIYGARYLTGNYPSLINEAWVRPSLEERPLHSELVENACYW